MVPPMSSRAYLIIPLRTRDGTIVACSIIEAADERVAAVRWRLNPNGYVARRGSRNTSIYLHREILGLRKGDGLEGDHINGNRLDNRRRNLRVATKAQNQQNVPSYQGTSQYRGVHWDTRAGAWRATATLRGRMYDLGAFDSELVAAETASDFRREHMPFTNEKRRQC